MSITRLNRLRRWLRLSPKRRAKRGANASDPLPVQLPRPPRDVTEPRWALAAPPTVLTLNARPVPLLELKLPTLKLPENRKIADD